MTIHIDNLTQTQVDMLDHMWSLDTEQDYLDWYETLDAGDQHCADVLQRLVILESVEEILGNHAEAGQCYKDFGYEPRPQNNRTCDA